MFNLFGISIHLYGLILGVAIWLAFEVVLRNAGKFKKNIEASFWWVLAFGLIGARAYHVIDFWPDYYRQNIIRIFYLWEGGLGIWGAVAGGCFGLWLFSRIKSMDFFTLVDKLILGVPLAQAIGRIGNFVNGELYGENGEPLFAYEALLNMVLFGVLWKAKDNKFKGRSLGIYLIGYGLIRILLEEMRPNEIIWRIGGIPTAIIFGVIAIFTGIALIVTQGRGLPRRIASAIGGQAQ